MHKGKFILIKQPLLSNSRVDTPILPFLHHYLTKTCHESLNFQSSKIRQKLTFLHCEFTVFTFLTYKKIALTCHVVCHHSVHSGGSGTCQGPFFYVILCQGLHMEVMGHVTPPYICSLRREVIVHAWSLYLWQGISHVLVSLE